MKNYLAVFTGTAESMEKSGWLSLTDAERQDRERVGIEAWGAWVKEHAGAIVQMGSPVGKTKRISKNGIADIRNNIGGYTVVSASSHEEAAKLFEQHPHFTHFPGDAVEVMECLPVPNA